MDNFFRIVQAQVNHQNELLAKQNVVGVAVGYKESDGVLTDEVAVVALVREKVAMKDLTSDDLVPREVDGVRTDVMVVGDLRAQNLNPRTRFRPQIPCGVSVGHHRVTAGTLGAVVYDRANGDKLLLSNNHVFANSNDATNGDIIIQPGSADGGMGDADFVARLERFVRLRYVEEANEPVPEEPTPTPTDPTPPPPTPTPTEPNGCLRAVSVLAQWANMLNNKQTIPSAVTQTATLTPPPHLLPTYEMRLEAQSSVVDNAFDAALARPLSPEMFTGVQYNLNQTVTASAPPRLGMVVTKSGRTTGITRGMITLLNATVNVGYVTARGNRTARFSGQVICEPMSQGGDSGSLVIDTATGQAVGLLFAGSPLATIFSPIDVVLNALNVRF